MVLGKLNIKLAIQKEGRLSERTIRFLTDAGFEFDSYKQRLFSTCRGFPMEILFLRDDDIPGFVSSGAVDMGIVGSNVLREGNAGADTLLTLNYGFCRLMVAVPKESPVRSVEELAEKTVATTYPVATRDYFKSNGISVSIIPIAGSAEISPTLGIADAVADLVSTGSTMALNDLRPIATVYESSAVLIGNPASVRAKRVLADQLLTRLKGVMAAETYKYVIMNVPRSALPGVTAAVPGLKSPTVSPLAEPGWVSVSAVVTESVFWDTVRRLKEAGATGILVLPIEKMIV